MLIKKFGCIIKLIGIIAVVGVFIYLFKTGWKV